MFSAKVTLKFQDSMTGVTGGLLTIIENMIIEAILIAWPIRIGGAEN